MENMGPGSNFGAIRQATKTANEIRAWPHFFNEIRTWPLFFRRALAGEERQWKIWWLGGIPVALGATAFTLAAEFLRSDGHHTWGNFFDVVKLLVYAAWFTAAWRSARKAENSTSRLAGRLAVGAGVVAAALTV